MRWRTSAFDVGDETGGAGRRGGAAESDGADAVSTRAIPKLVVRSAPSRARMANASRVTKAPNRVSADATARSNRFIRCQCAAKSEFDRRGNVTGKADLGKSQFPKRECINELDENRLIPADRM